MKIRLIYRVVVWDSKNAIWSSEVFLWLIDKDPKVWSSLRVRFLLLDSLVLYGAEKVVSLHSLQEMLSVAILGSCRRGTIAGKSPPFMYSQLARVITISHYYRTEERTVSACRPML